MNLFVIRNLVCFLMFYAGIILSSYAQLYLDLVKINAGTVYNSGFEDSDVENRISLLDISTIVPIPISKKVVLSTGVDVITQRLKLFPDDSYRNLGLVAFKAGVTVRHTKKFSGTYVFIPKFASEGLNINSDNFFYGGVAILRYRKRENLTYQFSMYVGDEAWGPLIAPSFGFYYLSPNKKWEANVALPSNIDLGYHLNKRNTIGFSSRVLVKSYMLDDDPDHGQLYAESSNIEIGPYFQRKFMNDKLLLGFKAGYSLLDYQVFSQNDKIPLRLSAIPISDDRTRLNSTLTSNFLVQLKLTYRLDLSNIIAKAKASEQGN